MQANIREQASKVTLELVEAAGLTKGQILVVGCSTSEILGRPIGTAGSDQVAGSVLAGMMDVLKPRGIEIAAQGCEHINRALVVERGVQEANNLPEVWVVPTPQAGGALASQALRTLDAPVLVERIQAHAGIDIGNTLIGMHLRPVVVPVRPTVDTIGKATVVLARTRPKLVGGARAQYKEDIEDGGWDGSAGCRSSVDPAQGSPVEEG